MCLMALIHEIPDRYIRFWNNAIEILINKKYLLNPREKLLRFQSNSRGVYFGQSAFLLLPCVMFETQRRKRIIIIMYVCTG